MRDESEFDPPHWHGFMHLFTDGCELPRDIPEAYCAVCKLPVAKHRRDRQWLQVQPLSSEAERSAYIREVQIS